MKMGTVMPDTVSKHLMESGDVETNPGPDECGVCGCRSMRKPTRCTQCLKSFCKTDCIGNRWKIDKLLKEEKPIVCRECKGEFIPKINLFNEGIEPDKCRADKCHNRKIKKDADFLFCMQCRKQYHKQEKCCEMTRKQVERVDRTTWQCPACISNQEKHREIEATNQEGESEYIIKNSEASQLKVMQLNIDSLKSKAVELRHYLKDQEIDVFLLQETKLIKKDKSPKIPGYTLVREDRKQPKGKENDRGGGLLIGVRDTIPFKEVKLNRPGKKDSITEWQTVEIPTSEKEKIRLTNVYVPPIRATNQSRSHGQSERLSQARSESPGQEGGGSERPRLRSERPKQTEGTRRSRGESPSTYENRRSSNHGQSERLSQARSESPGQEGEETEDEQQETEQQGAGKLYIETEGFDMTRWPHKEYDMIFGDVNAHSPLWDWIVERTDKRGKIVENWMAMYNMVAANLGGPTHTNRKTGKETAPDVAIIHTSILDKTTWETGDTFGSDHRPIIFTYQGRMPKVNNTPKYRWKLSKADWESYAKEIDKNLPRCYRRKNINKLEKRIRKTILKAANKYVGKKKCSPSNKTWMTEPIKEAIHERNQLRNRMPESRAEWIEACRRTATLVKEEKEKQWKEYVEEVDKDTDGRKIWRTIRAMDGRMPPQRKNEVLEVDGVGYVEDEDKAEQFAKTYKQFSRLPKRKTDRERKRSIIKRMRAKLAAPGPLEESEQDLTMAEMNRAIFGAGTNKASGDDDIPYEFIKNLGPHAKEMLLHLYQRCWEGEGIPSRWRHAVIKTLLKDGKDPKLTTSYRPISLTSCLGKILERIIAERLMYVLEERNLLNPNQAGFRQGRCTTDQVLKLVQDATDNIHAPKNEGHRTTVCFFDYAKAYDKVWRDGLISKMLSLNIPPRFIRFTRHFLSGRNTWVEVNNKNSKKFVLKEGLPQGSCISPLLFLIFINDIDVDLDFMTTASLFADDTSAWRRDGRIRGSDRKLMQQEIDKITDWADEWKMSINVDKTKCMVISSSTQDQGWNPELTAHGKEIEPVKDMRFLGITISNNMWFKGHIDNVVAKCTKRNKIIKCMSTKTWGNSQETQKNLYLQYNRSAIEYASSSWFSWISNTNLSRIQRIQNDALRSAAGLAKTCPIDFLHAETGVEPLKDRLQKNDMVMYERYLRLEGQDPRRKMLEHKQDSRLLTRIGWRNRTEPLMREYAHVSRPERPKPSPPWRGAGIDIQMVELEKKKGEYSETELLEKSLSKIEEIKVVHRLYTDGSTDGKQEKGGAGFYVTNDKEEEIHQAQFPAGEMCSSFQAECVAMSHALDWIADNPADSVIITDSQSMVMAIKTNDWKDDDFHLSEIKAKLRKIDCNLSLLWVPSHCNIPGNEKADQLANLGTKMSQLRVPVSEKIMKARIRRTKWKISHERVSRIYKNRRKPKIELERKWPRRVRTLYSRLRTGHSKELAQYRYLIEKEEAPECACGEEEETTEHVLCRCPLLQPTREKLQLGVITPDRMVTDPESCRMLLSVRFPDLSLV